MKKPREPWAITVKFRTELRTDGEVVRITITQRNDEIRLTKEQAESLVSQIYANMKLSLPASVRPGIPVSELNKLAP